MLTGVEPGFPARIVGCWGIQGGILGKILAGAVVLWGGLVLPGTVAATGCQEATQAVTPLDQFYAAIKDAEEARPAEVYPGLFAISRDNSKLIWRETQQADSSVVREVLVVTWMSPGKLKATFAGAPADAAGMPLVGGVGKTVSGRDIWATVVPQLQNFCAATGLHGPDLDLRLKQYLGLNPNWNYYAFAELWVRPEDIYRPCSDPEISDRVCNLESAIVGSYDRPVPQEYSEWYQNLKKISYDIPAGAPWTRLGYTFDWGNPDSEIGGSEYVLKAGATVTLAQLKPAEEYCTAPGAVQR